MKQFEVITGSGAVRTIEAEVFGNRGGHIEFIIEGKVVASFDPTGLSVIDTEHLIVDEPSDDDFDPDYDNTNNDDIPF